MISLFYFTVRNSISTPVTLSSSSSDQDGASPTIHFHPHEMEPEDGDVAPKALTTWLYYKNLLLNCFNEYTFSICNLLNYQTLSLRTKKTWLKCNWYPKLSHTCTQESMHSRRVHAPAATHTWILCASTQLCMDTYGKTDAQIDIEENVVAIIKPITQATAIKANWGK